MSADLTQALMDATVVDRDAAGLDAAEHERLAQLAIVVADAQRLGHPESYKWRKLANRIGHATADRWTREARRLLRQEALRLIAGPS